MYLLGVDLGGTNIAVGLTDENGKILLKDSVKTGIERGMDAVTKDMGGLCMKICDEAKISVDEIHSIGIGIPGTLDSKNGVITYANNLGVENYNIRKELSKYINKPVYISNDANCAALGEFTGGAAKEYNSAVMVTLGTGVGGGIILDKKLWEGLNSAGGEVGHIVINVGGEQCTCGRKGCWEAYSSATALIRDTKRAMDEYNDSIMHKLAEESGKVSGKTAFKAAKMGDKAGAMVVEDYINNLAEGLTNLINLLAPEAIILGGGVSNEGDYLTIPLKKAVYDKCYGGSELPHSDILIATLGNDAGIVGAAMLYTTFG